MAKKRSRRLLKKLKLGVFQELGFAFRADFVDALPHERHNALTDDLLVLIESRGLAVGGSLQSGFISLSEVGSATEADRKAVQDWLMHCQALKNVKVSPLVDAYFAPEQFV